MTDRDIAFVQKLDNRFLSCRSMRHSWRKGYFGPLRGRPLGDKIEHNYSYSPSVIVRQSLCINGCQTVRLEFFNPPQGMRAIRGQDFIPFARRYIYHEDYKWRGKESSKERPYVGDYNYEMYLRESRNGRN